MNGSEDKSDHNVLKPDNGSSSSEKEENTTEQLEFVSSDAKSSDSPPLNEAPLKEPEFEILNPSDFDELTGEAGSIVKSGASSLGSYADVSSLPDSPGVEATMEHSDMKKLLHEAGKESGESSTETEEHSPSEDDVNVSHDDQGQRDRKETPSVNTLLSNEDVSFRFEETKSTLADHQVIPKIVNQIDKEFPASGEGISNEASNSHSNDTADLSKIQDDVGASLYGSITYLGSSAVNAPVSDTELKRTLAVLKDQSKEAMDIILSIGATHDSAVKLIDPESKTVIATYQLQKILFCGRGDANGDERDCFGFNTCHGMADVFHCHVFQCLQEDSAEKILTRFSRSFRNILKPATDSGLIYKFDLVLDILEDDGKGSYTSVPRDKTCFKLRRDVHKQIIVTLHQLSNRLVIIERCFGLLICPGRNVTHADMNLLEKISMENLDNGRVYVISGNWNPEREDTLVLNTETRKDFTVHMTVAVDCVVSGISEPVRFIKEVGVKLYPSSERFWNPSRPKIKERYILELKLATDDPENEKSYEVSSLRRSTQREIKEQNQVSQMVKNEDASVVDEENDDEEDNDEPLMSGSGEVLRECSEEQLGSWAEVINKWKDVDSRPKQVTPLIRKQGVPEPLRAKVWQMLVGVEDSHYLVESYKDLIRKESPTEQVIVWDIHRTFPGHDYFRSSEGEGQENLHKICRAYSVYDDEVGYCQGMSFLAAVLLLHLPEEQAFGVFVKIMYDYNQRELFLNGFEQLNLSFFILERIIEEFLPDLHSHFLENNIESHMYCSQWFLTLFTAKFPLSLVYRIIDLYLSEGQHMVYQVALALLKVAKKDLLQLSFEGMLKYFRVSLPRRFIAKDEHNNFIHVVLYYKTVKKKLKKYEEEYEIKKEREKESEDPVERLQRENKQLMLANLRIEQENDALAYELVTTKVSLREKLDEAEERAEDCLRELEVLQKRVPELEDENQKFLNEGSLVKDLLRKSAEESEATRLRYESVIEQYKKICTQLDERSEQLKANLKKELKEIKMRIGSCETCCRLFSNESRQAKPGEENNEFKTSIKIEDSDQRMKELELELAQTKLSLVEAECNVQDLEHRLSSFMSAVAAEESKPWFRRSKLGTPAKK